MDRNDYNNFVESLNQGFQNGGVAPTYEQAVNRGVSSYGATVSPQEIGDTLYNLYSQYGPAPSAKYYGVSPTTDTSSNNATPVYTSGGGTATPDYSLQIQQLQNHLGNLPIQQNAGNTQIDNSYQTALQQLLGQYNQGQQSYNQNKQDSATNYVQAKNTIGSQAGTALNGLLRLLGSRGAGASSAVDAARQAVARGAGLQRGDVGTAFGQNQRGLDQNWGQYNLDYNNQVQNAGTQQRINKEALANQIDQSKAGLNTSIAGLQSSPANAQPYLDSANSILAQLSGYVAPSFNYNTTPYQAPTAASYTTAPQATPSYSNQSGSNDYFSPYLQQLLGKKQQTVTA